MAVAGAHVRRWVWLGLGATLLLPVTAHADPAVVVSALESFDSWRNTQGGLRTGDTAFNKLEIDVDADGAAAGLNGLTAHLQYFRTDGGRRGLSDTLLGDIQTASNIDAQPVDRLAEAWVQQQITPGLSLRAGVLDLNAEFDSIDPAALMINSSHGIGPDISGSGPNGPSIFPVTSLGVRLAWTVSPHLTLRAAAFDGVPGDLDHPGAFLSIRLSRGEGALLITQGEWAFAPGAQAVIGAWGYTARTDAVDPADRPAHQSGVYGFVQGPIPQVHGLTGWIRAGVADPDVQAISGYLGAGLVATGPLPARPHDNLGLAVAIAQLGDPTRRLGDLPAREIAWEATYSAPLTDWLTLQPDLQYIQHPAGAPGLDDALVVGLRIIVSLTQPIG